MSQYEGWTNIETFMVASIIDNDPKFFELIMDNVESYMAQSIEHQLEERLQVLIRIDRATLRMTIPGSASNLDNSPFVRSQLKTELRNAIFTAFFDAVDWDELTEHYKTKYVENLVNDKELIGLTPIIVNDLEVKDATGQIHKDDVANIVDPIPDTTSKLYWGR